MSDREELRKAIRSGEGKLPDNKEVINGKAFVAELDKCHTPEEIYALLTKSMDSKKLEDRVGLLSKNCHDQDLIVALESNKARINAEFNFRTSHEALVIMAADKYIKITEGPVGHKVIDFKKGLAEYAIPRTVLEKKETDAQKLVTQLIASRKKIK